MSTFLLHGIRHQLAHHDSHMLLTARKYQCRYRVSGSCSRESALGILQGNDPIPYSLQCHGVADIQVSDSQRLAEAVLNHTLSALGSDNHGSYASKLHICYHQE